MQIKGIFKRFFLGVTMLSALLASSILVGQAPLLGRQSIGSASPVTNQPSTQSQTIAMQSIGQASPIGLLDQGQTSLRQGFIQPQLKLIQTQIEAPVLISVHPNPVSDILTLRIDTRSDASLLIEISELRGRRVWSIMEAATALHTLDLSSLASGSYILTVIQQNRMTSTKFNKL